MLDKIISRNWTEAEQAAWRTAEAFGIPTGDSTPEDPLSENSPHLKFSREDRSSEVTADRGLSQLERNSQDAEGTLWFGETTSRNAHASVRACQRFGKPCMPIYPAAQFEPSHVATWIEGLAITTLHVTGNSEEDEPGIGDMVERFLAEVFQRLGHQRI